MRIMNVAAAGIGIAGGIALANRSEEVTTSRGQAAVAAGITAGAGLGVAGATYLRMHRVEYLTKETPYFAHKLHLVGVVAAFAGVAALGTIGIDAWKHRNDDTKPTKPNPNVPNPGDGNPVGTRKTSAQVATYLTEVTGDGTTRRPADPSMQALLAAGGIDSNVPSSALGNQFGALTQDEWTGTYSEQDRVTTAIAAIRANRSGDDAVVTLTNVDGATDKKGNPVTGDLDDQGLRAQLAQAAMRGQRSGTDAAYMYAAVRNALPEDVSFEALVDLTSAALERGVNGSDAKQMFMEVSTRTDGISHEEQVRIAAGAIRGSATADDAVADFRAIKNDTYVAQLLKTGELTRPDVVDYAEDTTGIGIDGQTATDAFVGVASSEPLEAAGVPYTSLMSIAREGLRSQRTGSQAAAAAALVFTSDGTSKLDFADQLALARAAARSTAQPGALIDSYTSLRRTAGLQGTASDHDVVLLAAANNGVLDSALTD